MSENGASVSGCEHGPFSDCAKCREADRIDDQMYRAGGAPDEGLDAENGAGAAAELHALAAENTRLMRGDSMVTPGQKLESWRFVVAETDTDEKRLAGLLGWMRVVEDQLDALRERLPNNVTELHRG